MSRRSMRISWRRSSRSTIGIRGLIWLWRLRARKLSLRMKILWTSSWIPWRTTPSRSPNPVSASATCRTSSTVPSPHASGCWESISCTLTATASSCKTLPSMRGTVWPYRSMASGTYTSLCKMKRQWRCSLNCWYTSSIQWMARQARLSSTRNICWGRHRELGKGQVQAQWASKRTVTHGSPPKNKGSPTKPCWGCTLVSASWKCGWSLAFSVSWQVSQYLSYGSAKYRKPSSICKKLAK